jgi:hypothetical protein
MIDNAVELQSKPRCPQCLELLDGASEMRWDDIHVNSPRPGDVTICIYCGEVLSFDDLLQLVKISADHSALLTAEQRGDLELAKLAIKARRCGASLEPQKHGS